MFVNQHMIKICFKSTTPTNEEKKVKPGKSQTITPKKATKTIGLAKKKSPGAGKDSPSDAGDVISLKYTIDYPRIELHPFDTRKFSIFFADTKIAGRMDCNRCIEMRASNRQSRDIIALLIRCFSAQTYFINSKIIQDVKNTDEEDGNIGEDEDANLGPKIYQVSDVLLELETVKRELYNQISCTQNLQHEKTNLSNQVAMVEEEMQLTIESYKSVLEASDVESDCGQSKTEIRQMSA